MIRVDKDRCIRLNADACRDTDGSLICDKTRIKQRRKAYFDSLLNSDFEEINAQSVVAVSTTATPLDDLKLLDEEEITDAITRLKNNKSSGHDGISAELFKHAGYEFMKVLRDIFLHVWQELEQHNYMSNS